MTTITLGKKLIPLEHIALIEPFDPSAYPRMKTERDFKARVVFIDRNSVLIEQTPAAFAEAHGLRMLAKEGVATNPAVHFSVETFEAPDDFKPTKPFRSRLLWRDHDGNTQSKLLVSAPERVLAVAVKGEEDPEPEPAEAPGRRPLLMLPPPGPR